VSNEYREGMHDRVRPGTFEAPGDPPVPSMRLGFTMPHILGSSAWRTPSGIVAAIALAFGIAYAVLMVLHPDADFAQRLSDFGETPIEFVALLLCIAVIATERRPQARAAWTLIALATASNAIGNVIYGIHDLQGEVPFPSLADAFYLGFYPLLLSGLLMLPTASARRDMLDWRTVSNVAIVIIGGGMAVLHFVLAPVIPQLGGDPLTSVILLAYPAGDLALLAALATVTARRPFAADQPSITFMGLVVALWLVADIFYAVMTASGESSAGTITDLLYLAGDISLIFAAHASLAQQHRLDRYEPIPAAERMRFGPYVMLSLGLITLIAAAVTSYAEIAMLAIMAVCLTGLVVVRQLADERERRSADALLLEAHRAAAADAERKARQDPLTGLANRFRLQELLASELSASAGTGKPVTIAFIDLNAFKSVNDTLGHAAGDELLVAVGQRLARSVRAADTVVRLGGDEFAIVLPKVGGDQALEIVRRAAATLDEPFSIAQTTVRAGGAVGLASSRGQGVSDLDGLLSRADTAMYRAKRQRLGPTFYDPAADEVPVTPSASLSPVSAT
jgi:diguanylate cyclase (GGDEF)-like protein